MRVQCAPTHKRLPARAAAASGACRAHEAKAEKAVATTALVAAGAAVTAFPALAAEAGALGGDALTAAGAVVGVVGLGGLLVATDPQRRRNTMAQGAGGDEMSSVKDYFEGTGSMPSTRVHRHPTPHVRCILNSSRCVFGCFSTRTCSRRQCSRNRGPDFIGCKSCSHSNAEATLHLVRIFLADPLSALFI